MHAEIGWMLRELPPPVDVTRRFLDIHSKECRAPPVPVRVVPGIFTALYPAYLGRIRRALNAREIKVDTKHGDLRENAARIRDAVLREPVPVVLLGQSKGPLDINAALVLHPEIIPKVRAFVSVQAPFGGTPLARPRSRLFEMSYARRQAFLREHGPVPQVPTVALATWTARAGLFLEKTRRFIEAPSDGFVPLADAHIPGAKLVVLEGIDHASLALRWLRPFGEYEPGRVVRALIALALE
ncbi:MAG: hypothetical protein LC689_22825 [Myxococcales bacterium]|nr:hypothetical protein [Myxococcales bacterium]